MNFKDLIRILHERAYVGRQDIFLLKLLKESVSEPDKIELGKSTLKGYFQGNNITELAVLLNGAKFSVELLEGYINKLCELSHKGTPTYNERYGEKLYKDILYEKAKLKYHDIPYEKMPEYLAIKFNKFLEEALPCDNIADMPQNPPTLDINDIEEVNIPQTTIAVGTNPVERFMIELKEVICNLKDIGHKIASRVQKRMTYVSPFGGENSYLIKSFSKKHSSYSQLESEYNKLQELYDSIDQYNTEHNNTLLADLLLLIAKINIEDFIETQEVAAISSFDNQYIFELNRLIQNYFE